MGQHRSRSSRGECLADLGGRLVIAAAVALCIVTAAIIDISSGQLLLLVGVASCSISTIVLLEQRKAFLPRDGLQLGFLAFLGVAGIIHAQHDELARGYTALAAVILLCVQLFIYIFERPGRRRMRTIEHRVGAMEPHPLSRLVLTTIILLVASVLIRLLSAPLASAMAFIGVVTASLSVLQPDRHLRSRRAVGALLLAVAAGAYLSVIFDGFGRLALVSLGLVPVVLRSLFQGGRLLRVGILLSVVPGLVLLGASRDNVNRERGAPVGSFSGIGSAVTPVALFGELLESRAEGEGLEPAYGSTMIASAVFWVPRSIWPGKPEGFGAVLTANLRPDLAPAGHSEAATISGEWYYNFGLLGTAASAVFLLIVARLSVRLLVGTGRRSGSSYLSSFRVLGFTVITVGLPDLVWDGTFTFASRTGSRLGVLAFVVVVWATWDRLSAGRSVGVAGVIPVAHSGATGGALVRKQTGMARGPLGSPGQLPGRSHQTAMFPGKGGTGLPRT